MKINKIFTVALIVLMPIILMFIIIGFHSHELILTFIHYFLMLLFLGIIIYLIFSIKKKNLISKIMEIKKGYRIILSIIISSELIGVFAFFLLLYGPIKNFREFLITSAMQTMSHKYLATWFYSEEEIKKVLDENNLFELIENTNLDLIEIRKNFNKDTYENEYEKEIYTLEDINAPYKIIRIEEKNFKGYLAVIYDASRIKVATTKYLNNVGQYVTEMAADEKAILAINGGGFLDENQKGTGGIPEGILIKNGKILSDKEYPATGGVIGFTKDYKLFLGRMNAHDAIDNGVVNAVSFRPFLIVNGKKSITKGNGGWGYAPRTAIGQRKDGIVLMLVVDGRMINDPGATLVDLMNILEKYGAYNAANLDGGTSSVMVVPMEEAKKYISEKEMESHCKANYCYINDIVNGSGAHVTRPIVSSFVVK